MFKEVHDVIVKEVAFRGEIAGDEVGLELLFGFLVLRAEGEGSDSLTTKHLFLPNLSMSDLKARDED